jgi:hypothetical protein
LPSSSGVNPAAASLSQKPARGGAIAPVHARQAVSFQQVVHPIPAVDAEVCEASIAIDEPDNAGSWVE